ncbi:MAG: NAD(P)-dependent oxidoreductase [Crocinitomicaceae bacterium]|nr:NAD(P)-dependent oxidoreductase [Crocinitomicaceae bacterium]
MKKKVLLTGASGTVGSEALKNLVKNPNVEIHVFDVPSKRAKKVFSQYEGQITVHFGDLRNREQVEEVCKNIDTVIHLAAIIPPLADEEPEFAELINVGGTKNLLESLEKYSPDAFFIYSSSVSVYGCRLENPDIKISDELKASPRDEYGKTKIKAEEILRNSKLDWTIFRLTAIMGVGNHKASGLLFEMPLETSVEICTPMDAARAFANAIDKREVLSRNTFNLGGGEKCRIQYRDLLGKYFQLFGLGEINFPEHSFAEHNFHCGFYQDGDQLQNILNFRSQDLNDYFKMIEQSVPKAQKVVTRVVQRPVKKYLLSMSRPYKAFKQKNSEDMNYFFKNVPS